MRDWWQPADETEFQKRARLLVEQFNGYSPVAGMTINGELTQGHWAKQMELFYELNPALPRVTRESVIADQFVRAALTVLGTVPGADAGSGATP